MDAAEVSGQVWRDGVRRRGTVEQDRADLARLIEYDAEPFEVELYELAADPLTLVAPRPRPAKPRRTVRAARPAAERPRSTGRRVRATLTAATASSGPQERTSDRVVLRRLDTCDQDEFLGLVSVSAELHRPWMSLPSSPEQYQAYLARYAQPDEESVLICVRSSGAIAGVVNINSIIRGRFQSASIAYAAFAPTAGQGYMTEGLTLVVRYAFEQLQLHRLEAQIQPENHASIGLVRRVGFRHEGYSPELLYIDGAWRDHERWAITNTMIDIAPTPPHATLPER